MTGRSTALAARALVVFLLLAPRVFAGAWTPPRGASYAELSVNFFSAEEEFDADGEIVPFQFEGRYTDRNLRLYGEYGLRDGVALIVAVPLQSIHYENRFEEGTTNGLGDSELGVRLRLFERPVVFSFQGLVKVPGWYEGEARLPLSNEQLDVEGRLQVGQSLLRGRMYYGVEAGYRFREGDPSDEWRYLLELGGNLSHRLYARAKLDGIASAHNPADVRDVFGNPVLRLEAELRQVETTVGFRFSRSLGAELGWTPIFWGRNTAKGTTGSAALVWTRPAADAR